MSKFILFLVLILVIGFAIYQIGTESLEKLLSIFEKPGEESILEEELAPEEEFPSERAGKFYISGGKQLPVFTKEVIVDPFKVKEGEEQIFSIWAKDTQGIDKVTATIATDVEEELIELELVEGTNKEGRWIGSWITRNISAQSTYSTSFLAINKEGKDTKMSLFWQVEK